MSFKPQKSNVYRRTFTNLPSYFYEAHLACIGLWSAYARIAPQSHG